jgi:hypothetical protein
MSSEGRFYCAHFQEATCMNMVAERGQLCEDCEAGKCGQPGVSCRKPLSTTATTTTTDSTTQSTPAS